MTHTIQELSEALEYLLPSPLSDPNLTFSITRLMLLAYNRRDSDDYVMRYDYAKTLFDSAIPDDDIKYRAGATSRLNAVLPK